MISKEECNLQVTEHFICSSNLLKIDTKFSKHDENMRNTLNKIAVLVYGLLFEQEAKTKSNKIAFQVIKIFLILLDRNSQFFIRYA